MEQSEVLKNILMDKPKPCESMHYCQTEMCFFAKCILAPPVLFLYFFHFKKQTKCIGLVFNHRFPILQACVYHKNTLFLIYTRLKLCMYDKRFLRNTTSSLEV